MIKENVSQILNELPQNIKLVAAAKGRTPEQILEAVNAGVKIIGENYVQEAQKAFAVIGNRVRWHFIGHLQSNKVKKAVKIFDVIETVDSVELAKEIDRQCVKENKTMQVLIEVNSAREKQKFGIFPEDALELIKKLSELKYIRIAGLMTMGPQFGNPEDARPYFVETRNMFEKIKILNLPNVKMQYLSMGMSNSYRIAIEEGANIVRIGTKIFGKR